MKLVPHSIRWRIQAWHGLLLLAVLAGLGFTAYRLQAANELRHLDAELQIRLASLHSALDQPNDSQEALGDPRDGSRPGEQPPPPPRRPDLRDEDRPPPPEGRGQGPSPADLKALLATAEKDGFYTMIWRRDGGVLAASPSAPVEIERPERTAAAPVLRTRDAQREAYIFTPPGECLLAGTSTTAMHRRLARFAGWLWLGGGGVLALGLAIGAWLASRAIAPIQQISAAATRIAAGHLSERIPVHEAGSELGELAGVLNATFARLEAAFVEQARFTSDAAHELRTPAAVILAQTQLALARPRSVAEHEETIAIVRRAALRMQELIESLLTLAQLDRRDASPERAPCNLALLAEEHLELIAPLAEERGITLEHELETAVCPGDEQQIAQIMANLLANAVKYSRRGDRVKLSTSRVNGCAVVEVADTGPGIAAQHLPHLFERFYRAEASRNRQLGGAGLGLAICKTIAEAHGGTILVDSELGAGTTFTVRLPAQGGGGGGSAD